MDLTDMRQDFDLGKLRKIFRSDSATEMPMIEERYKVRKHSNYKRRDLRYRADLQLVGRVSRPLINNVNELVPNLSGSVRICVDLYEVA